MPIPGKTPTDALHSAHIFSAALTVYGQVAPTVVQYAPLVAMDIMQQYGLAMMFSTVAFGVVNLFNRKK